MEQNRVVLRRRAKLQRAAPQPRRSTQEASVHHCPVHLLRRVHRPALRPVALHVLSERRHLADIRELLEAAPEHVPRAPLRKHELCALNLPVLVRCGEAVQQPADIVDRVCLLRIPQVDDRAGALLTEQPLDVLRGCEARIAAARQAKDSELKAARLARQAEILARKEAIKAEQRAFEERVAAQRALGAIAASTGSTKGAAAPEEAAGIGLLL